ncbi:hypothetical protein ACGFOU_36350 [Streptomyces sp. NPDC048595]|uniref:hypothetical protein n=1 Tax=Streptomyces sp. NPDC048595 TaxID=3365576 RepID=UPI0037235362
MSAASRPSPAVSRSPAVKARRLRTRLPWWALALPAVSFTALLALVAGASEAGAVSPPQGLTWLLEALARIVPIGV